MEQKINNRYFKEAIELEGRWKKTGLGNIREHFDRATTAQMLE
jgi:hypothetical protein